MTKFQPVTTLVFIGCLAITFCAAARRPSKDALNPLGQSVQHLLKTVFTSETGSKQDRCTALSKHLSAIKQRLSLDTESFKTIDVLIQNVQACQDDLDAKTVLAALPNLTSLNRLNLTSFGLQDESMATLAPYLPSKLKELLLGRNAIGEKGWKALAQHLPPTLTFLDLGKTSLGKSLEGVKALAGYLKRSSLTYLNLDSNDLTDGQMEILAPNLPSYLEKLELPFNAIQDAGFGALLKHAPKTLQYLNVAYNKISKKALEENKPSFQLNTVGNPNKP